MAKDWTMIRVTRQTRERLTRLTCRLLKAGADGHRFAIDAPDGLSVDAVIAWLLTRDERHRERARKARDKKEGHA